MFSVRNIRFSMSSAMLWLTIAALWLGDIQSARFAKLPLSFVLGLAAFGTVFSFRRSIPVSVRYTLAVVVALCQVIAIFMPSIH